MDKQEKQVQILRGLIRMQVENPHAYDLLMSLILNKQETLKDCLELADEPMHFHRLQGGIKSVKELLEFIEKPNELLRSIEKNLS